MKIINQCILDKDKIIKKETPNYYINVDSLSSGHIIPTIQNLILYYGKIDEDFGVPEGQMIATCATMTKYTTTTQSHLWVPLIWHSLMKLNMVDIPKNWHTLPNDGLKECVEMLVNLEGWDLMR